MKYTVQVNGDVSHVYGAGFFPRKYHYKKDAIAVAKQAIRNGAAMARVECPNGGELDFRPEKSLDTDAGAGGDADEARASKNSPRVWPTANGPRVWPTADDLLAWWIYDKLNDGGQVEPGAIKTYIEEWSSKPFVEVYKYLESEYIHFSCRFLPHDYKG